MFQCINPPAIASEALRAGKLKQSFSLVEVLVFTSIMSVFLVIAASVVTVSLRNMKFNEHKIAAAHYARQLEEWLRTQKEIDWIAFTANAGTSGTYCFNSMTISGWGSSGTCGASYSLNSTFKREVILSNIGSPPYQVNATITVSWRDLGQNHNVQTKTVFSVLE